MNGTTSQARPEVEPISRGMHWFPVAVFALVWLLLISRLRFEWSINPQYGYGWTVPFLAAYIFWRRSQNAPVPSQSSGVAAVILLSLGAALLINPVRLIQEAN